MIGSDNPRIKPPNNARMRDQITESPTRSQNRVRATDKVGRVRIGHLNASAAAAINPATSARVNRGLRNCD
jgi:hypothetical protein